MKPAGRAVLLDTCAVIWLASRGEMSSRSLDAIRAAGVADGVFVSTASAWEIGMLSKPRADGRPAMRFQPDPKRWFARFLAGPSIRLAPLTPEIAIDASELPGPIHGDPGDRLIVATARSMGVPIVTRDRRIITYADAGYAEVIAC